VLNIPFEQDIKGGWTHKRYSNWSSVVK
jgi:hypothetical protein